jgi:hypothetical protein
MKTPGNPTPDLSENSSRGSLAGLSGIDEDPSAGAIPIDRQVSLTAAPP